MAPYIVLLSKRFPNIVGCQNLSKYMRRHFCITLVLADDDKNDTVVRAQEISPLDSVKTLSYDELKILMETLEKESTRMSTNASHLSGKLKLENNFFKVNKRIRG